MTAHLSLKPESPGRPGALCFVTSTEEWWHEAPPKEATSARGPSLRGSWCQLLRVGVHGVLCRCVEASVWALLGSWDLLFPPFPRAPSLETQPRCLSVFRIQGWLLCEHFGVRGLDPVGTSGDACPGERRVGGVGAVGSPPPSSRAGHLWGHPLLSAPPRTAGLCQEWTRAGVCVRVRWFSL